MKPKTYLALAERLHKRARTAHRRGYVSAATDFHMAAMAARQLATQAIANNDEDIAALRRELEDEAAVIWLRTACA